MYRELARKVAGVARKTRHAYGEYVQVAKLVVSLHESSVRVTFRPHDQTQVLEQTVCAAFRMRLFKTV